MAKRSSFALDSKFFLQLSLGLFFLLLGIMGLGNYNSKLNEVARFLGRDDGLRVLSAVIELVMGTLLIIGLFFSISSGMARIFPIALFVLWVLYILYYFVFHDLFKPDFVTWLYQVSWRCIILTALWIVGKKYMD
jgi:hypothetical protein